MASELVKKTQGITTAKDMRESTQLIMKPYANWEEYLTPVPLYIAIMGELVYISSKTDFSINKNPPKGGYKYIRYPESFRACLMQVCNSCRCAFNEAHKSMDQIRIHTSTVPDYMKTAVLFQGSDEVAEHFYGDELNEIKKRLEEAKMREETSRETNERSKKAMKRVEKELEEATENARFRMEQTRAQLDKTGEIYEKCVENMEKNQKELTDILVTMRNCQVKEIDFNTSIEMLVKGMDAMGRVKEQWEKMVHFFQMVSNIVTVSMSKTLNNFVTAAEEVQTLSYDAKLFSKDLLYNQAFQASNIASLVHMISDTYTEVSNKYLMDNVSSLGKLMAMDKSKPEFEQEHQQLQNGCYEAQRGILQLVIKNKETFERRLEKIEGELMAILPAAAPEETKAIKEAVQAGMNEEEEASYY
ncbi:uncharacterized protein LOC115820058 [Chanos chanos]|uniref:Uncharacterized protein LOC115820058 n=1 Tax=Chanos chanos TaxID=29144 RepID=A0A6J2W5G7_CHACN|nr:uncharacterized protein LOC115820058 [Chanos chanos]